MSVFDPVQQVTDFRSWIYASVPVFDEAFRDGVLMFVNIHILLKIPMTLLSIIDSRFKLVLRHGYHVVDVVWAEEMLMKTVKCHATISS